MTKIDWAYEKYDEAIEAGSLRLDRPKRVAALLNSGRYGGADFLEARTNQAGDELLIINVKPALGQADLVNSIMSQECIGLVFSATDSLPEIIPFRDDFPDVPHLNATPKDKPRTICLYEELWIEEKRRWTAARFIEGIRNWLFLTARGQLHADEQPLDPVFVAGHFFTLIVPQHLIGNEQPDTIFVERIDEGIGFGILTLVDRESVNPQSTASAAIVIETPTLIHGRLRYAPDSLQDLLSLEQDLRVEIAAKVRERILHWSNSSRELLEKRLYLILRIPISRSEDGQVEVITTRAFMLDATAGEVGDALGVLSRSPEANDWAPLLTPGEPTGLDEIAVLMGEVRMGFSPQLAAESSGKDGDDTRVLLIGAGAVGSHIAMTLAKEGFGRWTIVDNDRLYPHNLARHALTPSYIGFPKAAALAHQLCELHQSDDYANGIVCDVLEPGNQSAALDSAIENADLIIDASASVAVSRWISELQSQSTPIVSIFLNPKGTDLVLLSQGKNRVMSISDVEIWYLLSTTVIPSLQNHFELPDNAMLNGISCREPSAQIAQSKVIQLCGIGAGEIRKILAQEANAAIIWKDGTEKIELPISDADIYSFSHHNINEWSIRIPGCLIDQIERERDASGNIETGGVLFGSWDHESHVVYVVGLIGPPPDSVRSKSYFVRGAQGLRATLDGLASCTLDNLKYVGEWHTHPEAYSSRLSTDDIEFLRIMREDTRLEDSPAIMLVAGNDGIRLAVKGDGDAVDIILNNDSARNE